VADVNQSPAGTGQPPGHDQYDWQALAFERALEAAATAAILAWLAATIANAAPHLHLGDLRHWLTQRIRAIPVNATTAVRARIGEGLRLGAHRAATDADLGRLPLQLGLDDATAAAVAGLDDTIRAGIGQAARLAEHATLATEADVTTVVAPALKATNQAGAATRWAANRAVNVGTAAVAEHLDAEIIWLAERNACLVCLALSGEVIPAGGTFDASLTFGDKPMPLFPIGDPQPLGHPPRHPGCRCRIRIWLPGSDPRFPEALKREAQRSVARGTSDYASEPAKLTAADRLLRHPTLLPASVRDRARRAVKTGAFTS
jgi:hypothetical protein